MAYKDKLDPTIDGFQELWDSMQNPTIERLIAGIQSKRTKPEQILKLTQELRESHSILDSELYRLGTFAQDYNSLWATNQTYDFGTTGQLQKKTQSQAKRWRDLCKITAPRYRATPKDASEPQSLYDATYLNHRPYEPDLWGPASYGTLITDLYEELCVIVDHLDEGKRLCEDVLEQEEQINKDPDWKEELYDTQDRVAEEDLRDDIEKHYHDNRVDTDNPMYQKMMTYPSERDFKSGEFHKRNKRQFNDHVITMSTLKMQENQITPIENQLWGDKFDKIKQVRFAIKYADQLLKVKPGGKFDSDSIVEMMKWCDVKISTKRHKDNEHVLFNYIMMNYQGEHPWPAWSNVFEINKVVKSSIQDTIAYSTRFERRLNQLMVELKHSQDKAE